MPTLALIGACVIDRPAESSEPDPVLILSATDGIGGEHKYQIQGDFQHDGGELTEGTNELIYATMKCVPSFSVNGEMTHGVFVIVDLEVSDLEPREIVECVKSRIRWPFNAGMGSASEPVLADKTDFREFYAQTH